MTENEKPVKTKSKKKSKIPVIALICVFVIGIGIMLYPSVANAWNTHLQKQTIDFYNESVQQLITDGEYSYGIELEKAQAYNNTLWPTTNPTGFRFLAEDDPEPEYLDCLNIQGDGVMGYVEIPKINIEIPIYHSTDETALLNGAGHLEGTSLPVGGESTHCVIAAHNGLPGAVLFTDLDKMASGDHFYLHVLDETLCYEVDTILTVEPEDVSDLVIIDGEDRCTLLTCTPYGVNTERLLVQGHRIPLEEAAEDEDAPFTLTLQNGLLIAAVCVAIIGTIILIVTLKRRGGSGKRGTDVE